MHEMQKQQRRFMIDSPDRCVSPSENCASSSLSQTIKRENTDVFSLFMAGIAGLRTMVFAYVQRTRLFTHAKTLSDAWHRSGSSSLSQTIKRENTDVFSLFMAGIAGLEPAMQESKSCALTDLAISHRYGVLYHIRRRCVKGGW